MLIGGLQGLQGSQPNVLDFEGSIALWSVPTNARQHAVVQQAVRHCFEASHLLSYAQHAMKGPSCSALPDYVLIFTGLLLWAGLAEAVCIVN